MIHVQSIIEKSHEETEEAGDQKEVVQDHFHHVQDLVVEEDIHDHIHEVIHQQIIK